MLVTGGTSYLGRRFARCRAQPRHLVFARTAEVERAPALVNGDVRDRAAPRAGGCDAISHSAALVSIWRRRRQDFDDVNVGGLRNVLDVAAAQRISRVLYTSSFLALTPRDLRQPIAANDYQRTKVAADRLADEHVRNGSPLMRVYPGVIYGPGSFTEGNLIGRLIADHLKGRLPGLVGPEHPWSYAYVDDVAEGHCAVLERGSPGARYVLGGENAPQSRVFELVHQIAGRRPPMRIPFPVAAALGAAEDCACDVGGTPLITRGAVEIFRHDWSLDSSRAVHDLDYKITPLDEGIRRTVASLAGVS
jgi:farnesol dehydrogenase